MLIVDSVSSSFIVGWTEFRKVTYSLSEVNESCHRKKQSSMRRAINGGVKGVDSSGLAAAGGRGGRDEDGADDGDDDDDGGGW